MSCVGVCPPSRPHVTISGPAGSPLVAPAITHKKQDQYDVSYTPATVGMYDISISANGKQISGKFELFFFLKVIVCVVELITFNHFISGSPFRVYVVCVEQIKVIGDTLPSRVLMTVHVPYKILLDLSDAGPGL